MIPQRQSLFLLLAEFGAADIPLEVIAEKYFGHSPDQARRKAAGGSYPFKVVRMGGTQKSPYVVPLESLAAWRDQQLQERSQ